MREILLEWIVEVHQKFQLKGETLFITVNLIDRYLEKVPISKFKKFQRKKKTQEKKEKKIQGEDLQEVQKNIDQKNQNLEPSQEQKKNQEENKKVHENKKEQPDQKENENKKEQENDNKQEQENEKQEANQEQDDENKDDNKNKHKKYNKKNQKKQQETGQGFFSSQSFLNLIILFGGYQLAQIFFEYLSQQNILDYKTFYYTYLEKQLVKKIVIVTDNRYQDHIKFTAKIITKDDQVKILEIVDSNSFLESLEDFQTKRGIPLEQFIQIEFEYVQDYTRYLAIFNDSFLYLFLFGVFLNVLRRPEKFQQIRNLFGDQVGQGTKIKEFKSEKVSVKFKDVAGQDEAKKEIMEFVDFLKNPKKYEFIGAKIPKGALLTGPPGTGKTLLAKACAGEAEVPFFFMSGSDFVEMFVGVGASRVRDLFQKAKEKSPSIIFIDEIDAVGKKREDRQGGGGNDERSNTLNQLLVEMDGFSSESKVIILAATNMKELLDPALVRPGRFDRQIEITNPDIEGRKEIFLVHLKPLKLDPSKSIEEYARRLASLTPGFSGADIMNLCNEAAILAARQNKKTVEGIDFEMATERVLAGIEKKQKQDEGERKIIAIHESGHAVCSWFLEGGDPLLKLTIIPRSKGSLGFAQYLPNESSLQSKEELLDKLCCMLGGRVAEEHFFGKITTGAYDDLQKVYKVSYALVTKYGMSKKVGYVGLKDGDFQNAFSDYTNRIIDEEIFQLIKQQTDRTRQIIKEKEKEIKLLSEELLKKKHLIWLKLDQILGERPFQPKSNFKAYLEINDEMQKEKEKLEQAEF
ncbi:hypothetical protein IMG5_154700 [Ichthyophthirius multifiliis]|uniref:AAA+ ATPase domain-containing protein n=1 Tax=Ichthyophthirius multifiliis TaxID=5932 RepID=G0QZ64_ICHMU|nr:hypothetical protein IMG5_154700 [Ichthyophthirius multifiliis]EGR29487.1 hypothetical protein IMG5_154700 [Ichthyophthirius multifiliis]|eukprot:XP_004030723.1 hypothetical protein IMG5_154700 [Ichthyophthirius multifiliis]